MAAAVPRAHAKPARDRRGGGGRYVGGHPGEHVAAGLAGRGLSPVYKDYPAEADRGALFQYAGLVVALSLLWLLCRGAGVLQ